jgi:CubicO group peptidase (beta-lactamase class C family)
MKIIYFVLILIFSIYCNGQIKTEQNLDRRIEFALDSLRQKFKFPGFAMTVVRDTSIVYEKIDGLKRIEHADSITDNTKFYWASVSKVFTATAIMKLAEEDKLNIDDLITKYYPEFKTRDGKFSSDSITIRNLLTHSSGLRKHLDNTLLTNESNGKSAREALRRLRKIKLEFKPGSDYLYSNIGTLILGVIIENLTGKYYEEYMQQNIFSPLGMINATFYETNNLTDKTIAAPHVWSKHQIIARKRIYTQSINSSGGLMASIKDMSLWMKACMNMGLNNQCVILRPENFTHMWNDSLKTSNSVISGLTWDTKNYKGHPFAAKGGNLEYSSRSYIIIFKDLHLGIAMVTNFDFKEWDSFMLSIIDVVLESCVSED